MVKEIIREIVKEILTGETTDTKAHSMIGKVCVFRTYSAGVHVGTLKEKDGRECIVNDSRRIWSWKEACSLSQLAMDGSSNIEECKIAVKVPEICLTEVIEIIPMSQKAIKNIMESKEWKK